MKIKMVGLILGGLSCIFFSQKNIYAQNVADQVVIRRTDYGVPHIKAENLRAAGYAMGYIQMEDYGETIIDGLIKACGTWARYHELEGEALRKQLDKDVANRLYYEQAVSSFHRLNNQTRKLTEGYAEGINKYIELHSEEFPDWVKPNFTGVDVHAVGIGKHGQNTVKHFIRKQRKEDRKVGYLSPEKWTTPWTSIALNARDEHPDIGSNAWALAPGRTKSGKAILLRNPHLYWDAGYYEAQMEVNGLFNFYGDFRIGQPLGVVGGFNKYLGWSTTNNHPDLEEIYALKKDPKHAKSYLLDGQSHTLKKKTVTVFYKKENHLEQTQRIFYFTPYGSVIYRNKHNYFIIKSVADGEFRNDQQYLKMMQAKNLDQWKEAMSMQGLYESNFTYADGDGNIFYVWNAATPILPYAKRDKRGVIHVSRKSQIWTDLYPWNQLPHLLNPKGGYLHNENDPFYYTNLNEIFHKSDFPDNFPKPKLGLRSQLSIQLIGGSDRFSLEDVVRRKGTLKMLLADRVKADLIQAILDAQPQGEEKEALDIIKKWDNTVSKESKGSILFKIWWYKYVALVNNGHPVASTPESVGFPASGEKLFAVPWSKDDPIHTPYGLADKDLAVKAFHQAIQDCKEKYGSVGVEWGTVHRAKIGKRDYAVGGATGSLGCFRVLWYAPDAANDRKLDVKGGDGWVIAVEFGDIPRAYSVLAYGDSNKEDSPYYGNQLKMFVDRKMKTVRYTEADIKKHTKRIYHPGEE